MATILARPVARDIDLGDFRPVWTWFLCWILLPNAGYWALWIVGGPPRAWPVLAAGFAGIVAHRAPFWARFALFILLMIHSALAFIAALFNLSIGSLTHSLRFAAELSPSASIEYVVAGIVVLATGIGAWKLLRRPAILERPVLMIAAAAITIIAASVDVFMADGNRGSYHRTPDAGAPFDSATRDSGLERIATGQRHVLMVMVEAMGLPSDPALRTRLMDIWARPEIRDRYEVTTGSTLFYGSTTNGEMRELCGRWAEYDEVMGHRDGNCLPARLARRGYRTEAWHSFVGSFFDRTQWYPNIGFQETRWGPDMIAAGAQGCPGVFPGACDRDVPRQIAGALREAKSPQFLYWLTVNSHLPVVSSAELGTEDCARYDAALARDYPMICRMFQLYDQTGAALASEIAAEDFPATDILIVGDHLPPFFDRHHRAQFAPDSVPWVLLRPKNARLRS